MFTHNTGYGFALAVMLTATVLMTFVVLYHALANTQLY